jgi:hypothetical protein
VTPLDAKRRIQCISFYLGLAPFFFFILFRKDGYPGTKHHLRQSLVIFFILFCIFIFYISYFALATALLLYSGEIYKSFPFDIVLIVVTLCLLVLWVCVWTYGFFLATLGSTRKIPLISRIADRRILMSVSFGWTFLLFAGAIITAFFANYSTRLASDHLEPREAYMLYDDMGFIPHWVFTLAFSRMSLAATEQWGQGSVVITPLSRSALNYAFQNGHIVFVASHGEKGLIKISRNTDERFGPKDVILNHVGSKLQFVYLAGCDSGTLDVQWREALAPAEVKTFDRLSAMAEHAAWLWGKGPRLIRSLR